MNKLSIKLKDDFTFEIDSINEMYNGADASATVSFRIPLAGGRISEIQTKIKPDNLERFAVIADEISIDEYSGYSVILAIDKNITKYEQVLIVRAKKKD